MFMLKHLQNVLKHMLVKRQSRWCRYSLGGHSDWLRLLLQRVTFHVHHSPAAQIPVLRYSPHRAVLSLLTRRRLHLRSSTESNWTTYSRYDRAPGARFTKDLRIILRQFSHLRSSPDNDLIHRTLTTYLKSDRSCNHLRQVLWIHFRHVV